MRQVWYGEWLAIAVGSGIYAGIGANVIAAVLSHFIFNYRFVPSIGLLAWGIAISFLCMLGIAWFGSRPLLKQTVLGGLTQNKR
jgi:predicted lysophospholipase L1 biosynthesis ABC-type transport system permease subunit